MALLLCEVTCHNAVLLTPLSFSASAFQAQYKMLTEGGSVPVSAVLREDLQTIARVAKLGQDNLYKSVLQCCRGGSTAPFTAYVKSLDSLVRGYAWYSKSLLRM
jgi:hypothetical protein